MKARSTSVQTHIAKRCDVGTKARDKSYDESLDAALLDPVEAATYLEAVLEMDDPAALLLALRQVAKAHGMAEVAGRAELGEKTLFKAPSENGNPTICGDGQASRPAFDQKASRTPTVNPRPGSGANGRTVPIVLAL